MSGGTAETPWGACSTLMQKQDTFGSSAQAELPLLAPHMPTQVSPEVQGAEDLNMERYLWREKHPPQAPIWA